MQFSWPGPSRAISATNPEPAVSADFSRKYLVKVRNLRPPPRCLMLVRNPPHLVLSLKLLLIIRTSRRRKKASGPDCLVGVAMIKKRKRIGTRPWPRQLPNPRPTHPPHTP